MAYLLLAADPDENVWTILLQSDSADDLIDEIQSEDHSHRIVINTENFITYDTKEAGDGPTQT